jgi:hypothetical protein
VGPCDLHPVTHRIPFGKQTVLQNQVAVVFGFLFFLISAAVSLSGLGSSGKKQINNKKLLLST